MKQIARVGIAVACVAIGGIRVAPALAQVGNAPSQPQYSQQYPNSMRPPAAQEQPNAAPQPVQTPPPPFVLTPQEQEQLDRVLDNWEQHSSQITTFKCDFKHWVYDPTFLPPTLNAKGELDERPIKYSTGAIKYSAPDKGLIEETDVWEVVDPGTPGQKSVEKKYGEHWACDGKTLYAVDHEQKKVHRTKLPPEMQGNLITEGPLPFAFGTKAGPLKARYFLRVVTPPNETEQVWLEIRPRFQKDLTNFLKVEVILGAKEMRPTAIQITHAEVKVPVASAQGPKMIVGRQREVYQFDEKWFTLPSLFSNDFAPVPFGYQVIDEKTSADPPPANGSQARRQWPLANPQRPY